MGSVTAGLDSDCVFMDWIVFFSFSCGKPEIRLRGLELGLGTIIGLASIRGLDNRVQHPQSSENQFRAKPGSIYFECAHL